MFGYETLRETWNTQWGPTPVLALQEAGRRDGKAPITLSQGAARARRVTGARLPR